MYLNERGGGLGSGDRGSVGEAGRQRRLLCQEKRFSALWAHRELRHNLRKKGEVRTPLFWDAPEGVVISR